MKIKDCLSVLIGGISAGIAISIGGAVYTACTFYGHPIVGSILFSCGLLLVCFFGFKLYTGKIGKVFENKPRFILDLFIMYIGNFIGAFIFGCLSSLLIKDGSAFQEIVNNIASSKILLLNGQGSEWYRILINSIFCGVLVYLGVEVYIKAEKSIIKVVGLVFCVTAFVVCGYSHCVANMFYLSNSRYFFAYPLESFLGILISTLGNSIGAIIMWFLIYCFNLLSKPKIVDDGN